MGLERHHSAAWMAASLVTVVSFVAATAYSQNRLARLDALSSAIEQDALPSIEHLSHASVRLTRLNQLVDDLSNPGPRRVGAVTSSQRELAGLKEDIDRYLRLRTLPDEEPLWAQLRADVNHAVGQIEALTAAPGQPPAAAAVDQANDALDAAVRSVVSTLDFDVSASEAMARDVRRLRVSALRMIVELEAMSCLIAVASAVLAFRATRRHDQLLSDHNALLTARVSELDRFTGRVAHDVLSPLGTISTGLALLRPICDEQRRTYLERSQRALTRVQQLVNDLLKFAQAGARPDPAGSCALDTIVVSIVTDSADAAAERGIDIVTETVESVRIPCSPGVATSIVQNLLRNAIKYMGPQPIRKITVRASTAGVVARLEVEDTGPGIPREIEATLFEPFVRGPHEQASGSGLGLATVKRLVDSHGGRVGVKSSLGVGTVFWVELPHLAAQQPRRER